MTRHRKKQLETHRSALVENMNLKAVINRLCSHQVLTVREAEQTSRGGGTADQNEKLLDCLLRKPDTAFEYCGMHFDKLEMFFFVLKQLLGLEACTYHF